MASDKENSTNSVVTPQKPDIELRSPRMRRLLDNIPGHLAAWLTALSLLIIAGVIIAAALLPYPHSGGESILRHLLN